MERRVKDAKNGMRGGNTYIGVREMRTKDENGRRMNRREENREDSTNRKKRKRT